jgi:hypothetical protein
MKTSKTLSCFGLLVLSAVSVHADVTEVIVVTNDVAPDGNGTFVSRFSPPSLNDAGQTSFTGYLTGTSGGSLDDYGIFRSDGTTLTQIAREGDAAPDGNGTFFTNSDNFLPALNNAGQTAFFNVVLGTSGGFRDSNGIFLGDGTPGGLIQIARGGDAAPDGNGSLLSLNGLPALNQAGQVAFESILIDTSGGSSDDTGIFRGDGSTLIQIAREGDAAPDGNGIFSSVGGAPGFNEVGQLGFIGAIDLGDGGTVQDDFGVFRGNGSPGSLTRIVREGDAAPDANGSFSSMQGVSLNAAGQVWFTASLVGTSGGTSDDGGIFRGDGTPGGLIQMVRKGDAAPDGNGNFSGFGNPKLNDAGQFAFGASLTGTSGGSSDDGAIFRGGGTPGGLIQIVREGDASPDGNGSFSSFSRTTFNDAGQAAFGALLTDTTSGFGDDIGIFFFDGTLGLHQVAREGDSLLGGTITSLSFLDNSYIDDGRSGLNGLGQVAFNFTLHNGLEGIAIWTPQMVPEPTSLALLGLGGLTLLNLRRSRKWPQHSFGDCVAL